MSVTYIPTALRNLVYERAEDCCEYCLISEETSFAKHQIDHIIAEKHGGETTAENLALACTLCNKYKGSDLSSIDGETGEIVRLFNPRKDVWGEHFRIENGVFIGLTSNARATIRLLQLNSSARVEERLIASSK
ncbi:MAG TPA: HNH endonuclease signature motif containing protein [Pyrinomonadaceae bacterium]|nr:HNH endonuclease signature motif containing protein [Pyrinomonadaceae bacterium]